MTNLINDSRLIVDIGMHIGNDTDFYLKKGFKVAAVEANPQLVEKAKQRFSKEIAEGQLQIFNIGMTEERGEFDFFINENKDDWSSFNADWNKSMFSPDTIINKVKVSCMPLNDFLDEAGIPYYLKIDVEGYDVICIAALHKLNKLPKYLSVELPTYNNLPGQEVLYVEILCHLNVLGYKRFKIIDQSLHETLQCPTPALEGKYINYSFDGFSSGLFGEELPGEWQDIDTVMHDYLYYVKNYHLPDPLLPNINRSLKSRIKQLIQPETNGKEYYRGKLNKYGWFDVHATY